MARLVKSSYRVRIVVNNLGRVGGIIEGIRSVA